MDLPRLSKQILSGPAGNEKSHGNVSLCEIRKDLNKKERLVWSHQIPIEISCFILEKFVATVYTIGRTVTEQNILAL